ncbi:TPA: pilus assembly protein [Burkholderia stabilis]|uniref:TadE family protein n=1 Tax=Burkholderia stabilis TaxID=95485 RepID=UPI00158EDAC5|nr:TadE/TadG family type IV pilus assembly protein [Burkholderia stabilis]HDR9585408.1 pilus assembly protein [Burkholderia stabilis]HDR9648775.1 pilus assembly protein [Burkholderia stabilis]HDR9657579.1 pilus assembly protein [Burkholderia stabilis]HDR9682376.1 pilus assembly protein [Burkholderia stabilis]
MKRQSRPRSRRRQLGATAVEFALVFPLFFLILYAIVTFGLIFAVQQGLTLAATEGARTALNYVYEANGSGAKALTDRAAAAKATATGLTSWLSNVQIPTPVSGACSYDATMYCVTVTVTYPYQSYPLVPSLPLIGLVTPTQLTGTATVQINPATIL